MVSSASTSQPEGSNNPGNFINAIPDGEADKSAIIRTIEDLILGEAPSPVAMTFPVAPGQLPHIPYYTHQYQQAVDGEVCDYQDSSSLSSGYSSSDQFESDQALGSDSPSPTICCKDAKDCDMCSMDLYAYRIIHRDFTHVRRVCILVDENPDSVTLRNPFCGGCPMYRVPGSSSCEKHLLEEYLWAINHLTLRGDLAYRHWVCDRCRAPLEDYEGFVCVACVRETRLLEGQASGGIRVRGRRYSI